MCENPRKCRCRHFLGFSIRRYRNGKLLIKPSRAAVRRVKRSLAGQMRRLRGQNASAVLAAICPITRGHLAASSDRSAAARDLCPPSLGRRPPRWDLSPSPDGHLALSTHRVFVSEEASLDVSFPVAQARLTGLIRGGLLGSASAQAYRDGITGLARLVQVHFQDPRATGESARLALRWEAAGPGGGLFPVLDADITLTAAGKHSTTVTLTGAYRPSPGSELDRAILRQVATATIRAFLYRVTEAISHPARAAGPATEAADPDPPPLPPEPETP